MMRQVITINDGDDLAVALADLPEGTTVEVNGRTIELKHSITAKHKFALKDFEENDEVHMYGVGGRAGKEPHNHWRGHYYGQPRAQVGII